MNFNINKLNFNGKNLSCLIVILFSCITYSQKDSLELNSLNLSLKKAKVATFYSATRLNAKMKLSLRKNILIHLKF